MAALLSVHLQGCGEREGQRFQGLGSHTVRFDLDAEATNNRNYVNYLVIVAITVMFAVVISWRLTAIYFPRTITWIWTTTMSMSSRMRTWWLRRGRQGEATEDTVKKEEVEELGPYV